MTLVSGIAFAGGGGDDKAAKTKHGIHLVAVKGQNEGQARIQAIEPEFTAGSPFCKGTGFDVKTTAFIP